MGGRHGPGTKLYNIHTIISLEEIYNSVKTPYLLIATTTPFHIELIQHIKIRKQKL